MDSASTRRNRLPINWAKAVRASGSIPTEKPYGMGGQSIRGLLADNTVTQPSDASGTDKTIQLLQQLLNEIRKQGSKKEAGAYLDPAKYYVRQTQFNVPPTNFQLCSYNPDRVALYMWFSAAAAIGTLPTVPITLGSGSVTSLLVNRIDHYGLCTSSWYTYASTTNAIIIECIDRSYAFE